MELIQLYAEQILLFVELILLYAELILLFEEIIPFFDEQIVIIGWENIRFLLRQFGLAELILTISELILLLVGLIFAELTFFYEQMSSNLSKFEAYQLKSEQKCYIRVHTAFF